MPETLGDSSEVGHTTTMQNKSEYIDQCLKENKYLIMLNGKEVKRMPFLKQAISYAMRHNGEDLFSFNTCEVIDIQTGAIMYPYK